MTITLPLNCQKVDWEPGGRQRGVEDPDRGPPPGQGQYGQAHPADQRPGKEFIMLL